jgi:hypothetical protein
MSTTAAYQARVVARRRAADLCVDCGKRKPASARIRCVVCLRRACPVFLDRLRGRALSLVAINQGISRRWYERLPWLGDRWLRRRMVAAVAGQPRGRAVGT